MESDPVTANRSAVQRFADEVRRCEADVRRKAQARGWGPRRYAFVAGAVLSVVQGVLTDALRFLWHFLFGIDPYIVERYGSAGDVVLRLAVGLVTGGVIFGAVIYWLLRASWPPPRGES